MAFSTATIKMGPNDKDGRRHSAPVKRKKKQIKPKKGKETTCHILQPLQSRTKPRSLREHHISLFI